MHKKYERINGKYKATKLYRLYGNIKTRCYNHNSPYYKYWGGRGIRMCKRWLNSFDKFCDDVGYPTNNSLTLDRINVNKNYTPSNVRWADRKTQGANKTNSIKILLNGVAFSTNSFSELLGVTPQAVYYALFKAGYSPKEYFIRIKNKFG